jgi:hypothetical protein
MPALSSTREGYLQSPISQTGSPLVLAFGSSFECGQSGSVLLASGRITVVTSVTTLWKGVLDLWSDTRVFSRVYGGSPRGCCGFVVTTVTAMTLMTVLYGLILNRGRSTTSRALYDLSMGRLLEKPGPALYSPECVEGEFCDLRHNGVLRSSFTSRAALPWCHGAHTLA